MTGMALWEVFVRDTAGMAHRHSGSVQAASAREALHAARNIYARRGAVASLWVVPAAAIATSGDLPPEPWFGNPEGKPFRAPDHFDVPEGVKHL